MILSEERVSFLTHQILESLIEKKWATLLEEETRVLREIKKIISAELKLSEEIDQMIRQKIFSYSRRPVEGSSEWEILYKKFFIEELAKRQR
jgi:hypothetical protein